MVFQISLGLFLLFSKVVIKNWDLALLNRKTALFRAVLQLFQSAGVFYLFAIFRSLSRSLSCLMTELSKQGDFLAIATRLAHKGQFQSSAILNNSHEESISSISSKVNNESHGVSLSVDLNCSSLKSFILRYLMYVLPFC